MKEFYVIIWYDAKGRLKNRTFQYKKSARKFALKLVENECSGCEWTTYNYDLEVIENYRF